MTLEPQSARASLQALRERTLSATELMAATFDRIERLNPRLNAIVSLASRETALAEARAADAGAPSGPLHGLPIAIKDHSNAAGFPTIMGAPVLAASPPAARDDIIVARLRAAGAIVIGKTNTPAFCLGSHTTNPVFGATLNPWDPTKTPGGSSGGAAVALAAGMTALADGSDMMGSLRNPAGWTNLYALRPTVGAVPSEPLGDAYLHRVSTHGPMARDPEDLALMLSIQAGPDPRQPYFAPLSDAPAPPSPRVGWLADWGGALPMEAGVLDQCVAALDALASAGARIEPLAPPHSMEEIWSSWSTLRSWAVAATLRPFATGAETRDQINAPGLWEFDRGAALTALEIHDASVARTRWFAAAAQLFERFDVLALPTAQCWPFDVGLDWPKEIAGVQMDTYHRWMQVMLPASLIGLPAVAVPAGFGVQGLPMGVQLIGRPGSDYQLIELARRFHAHAPWAHLRPQLDDLLGASADGL